MKSKTLLISLLISSAIAIAILSMPEIMEGIATRLTSSFGPSLILIAILILGIIHGLKPDEHTWPITIPYAISQKSLRKGILASVVFTGALTLIWTLLSALTSQVLNLLSDPESLSPYADLIAGSTMIAVASLFIFKQNKMEKINIDGSVAPDYKYIWIHGLAAAFGGDFIVVLLLSAFLLGSSLPLQLGFLIGLLFGIGSMLAQTSVVYAVYKGFRRILKNTDLMAKAGVLSLFFLGIFLALIGMISLI